MRRRCGADSARDATPTRCGATRRRRNTNALLTTHRRRIADATSIRHRRVAHASPTPCLRRSITWLVFNIISSHRHPNNATHRAPTHRLCVADAKPTPRADDATPTRCIADVSQTRRRCVTDATPTHRLLQALHAKLFGLSSTSFPHLAIQPSRRIARRRDADASTMRRERVADATPTHRRRVGDSTPMRHLHDADASPTPCLIHVHAPLLGLSSTSFHLLVIQPTRRVGHRRLADTTQARCRTRRCRRVAPPTRRRRVASALP